MSNSVNEEMIESSSKRVKLSECENEEEDRLSNLPDCVITHILSFLNTKHAVTTCVLSVRWKDIWKRIPSLKCHISEYQSIRSINKVVARDLSFRDSSITLDSLDIQDNCCLKPNLIKRVVNYAISHKVQQFRLVRNDIEQFSSSIFSCQTLTHLKLYAYPAPVYPRTPIGEKTLFPKSFSLPALTTLHLGNFAFCANDNGRAEPFSAFNQLSTLVLCRCGVRNTLTLCISSATLVNFTMRSGSYDSYKIELCTTSLGSFSFIGKLCEIVSGSNLSYVKHVDIDAKIRSLDRKPPMFLLSWLLELANTKSLTVTASTLQVLSLNSNLLKIKLSSLGNLKSLKVKRKPLEYVFLKRLIEAKLQKIKSRKEAAKLLKSFNAGLEPSAPIPDGILDFLIQNSPLAEVEIKDYSKQKEQSSS